MDYKKQRDEELYRAFLRALQQPRVNYQDAVRMAVNSPCSRHWISPFYFYRLVLGWDRGYLPYKKPTRHRESRENTYRYLYSKYKELKASPIGKQSPMFLCCMVIYSPAKSFGLQYGYASRIISDILNGRIIKYE